jgi:hypothetical protein
VVCVPARGHPDGELEVAIEVGLVVEAAARGDAARGLAGLEPLPRGFDAERAAVGGRRKADALAEAADEVMVSGTAAVRMADGSEFLMRAGDFFAIPPGHDSWVVGDEVYISLHLLGADAYAQGPTR